MPCPICDRDVDPKYKPFCSRRCADADLGKWLTESYRIPLSESEDAEEAAEPGDDPNQVVH